MALDFQDNVDPSDPPQPMTEERLQEIRELVRCVSFIDKKKAFREMRNAVLDLLDALETRIAALERERDEAIERFQLETLRTSDQFDLLKRAEQQFVASWSCPCENERECCRIVKAIRSLAAQPVNDVGSKKHITVIRSRVAALERERDEALKWKAAVQNAAVVSWTLSAENENDPTKAVNDLLCWTQQVALDPAVSAEAKSWRDRIAALVGAVEGLIPPPCGDYGGPLVSVSARYEDGTVRQIGLQPLARAEAAMKERVT